MSPGEDESQANLTASFTNYLEEHSLSSILADHVQYATKLANACGPLIYEEMAQLFHLCDEIEALSLLGLQFDEARKHDLMKAVHSRMSSELKTARAVAENLAEPWKAHWSWYAITAE